MPRSAVFFLQDAFLCHDFVLICHNKKNIFLYYIKVLLCFFPSYKCNTTLPLILTRLLPPRNEKVSCSLSINVL